MEDKTFKEYRLRIARIYKWWMEKYPNYFENGTRVLNDDEKNDITKFHHTNQRDIIYGGLKVQYVMAFLSAKKKKSTKPMVLLFYHQYRISRSMMMQSSGGHCVRSRRCQATTTGRWNDSSYHTKKNTSRCKRKAALMSRRLIQLQAPFFDWSVLGQ